MSLKHAQTANDCCGAYADIGSVISTEDNVLELNFGANDEQQGMATFSALLQQAQQRFEEVSGQARWDQEQQAIVANITFSCAAERLIFEMNQ